MTNQTTTPYHPTIGEYTVTQYLISEDETGVAISERDSNGQWEIIGNGFTSYEQAETACTEDYICDDHADDAINQNGICDACPPQYDGPDCWKELW